MRDTNRKIKILSDKSAPVYENGNTMIMSLSPNEPALNYLDQKYKERAQQMIDSPGVRLSIGADFNFQSIVLVHDSDHCRFLYGSDLEHHEVIPEIGWDQVYNSGKLQERKVRFFKVPHHGSENGCNQDKWNEFLEDSCHLNITPYSRGSKLPNAEMVDRLNGVTDNAFITSRLTSTKIPTRHKKKLEGLKIRLLQGKRGGIESVQNGNTNVLDVNLHGSAIPLKDFR